MKKLFLCFTLLLSLSFGGSFSGSYYPESSSLSVILPVTLQENQILNLQIRFDQSHTISATDKFYKADGYKQFSEKILVELRSKVLDIALNANITSITQLQELKATLEKEINAHYRKRYVEEVSTKIPAITYYITTMSLRDLKAYSY